LETSRPIAVFYYFYDLSQIRLRVFKYGGFFNQIWRFRGVERRRGWTGMTTRSAAPMATAGKFEARKINDDMLWS
jgi:hypothetical protein